METIGELVRGVVVIVILASFIEMLMPNGEIKRLVKVIMGLFVLVSVLNPILDIFQQNVVYDVSVWQQPDQAHKLSSILRDGSELSRQMDKQAEHILEQRMGNQIKTIVGLVKGVTRAEVEVKLNQASSSTGISGINQVEVLIETTANKDEPKPDQIKIETVIAEEQKGTKTVRADEEIIKNNVIKLLEEFYHLTPDQIRIKVVPE